VLDYIRGTVTFKKGIREYKKTKSIINQGLLTFKTPGLLQSRKQGRGLVGAWQNQRQVINGEKGTCAFVV
jgi:hypothetical protein